MTETEYIEATNLQKMRIVCNLLRDMLPDRNITDGELKELNHLAVTKRIAMFEAINLEQT